MFEPISIGIASNIIFAGGAATRTKARQLLTKKKYSEDIDKLGTKFNRRLEDAIENVAETQGREALVEITDNWAEIAVHVDRVEILFEDQDEAVERIADAIVEGAPESIYADERLRADLCLAVSHAYDQAVTEFQSDIAGTELGDELNQRANIEIARGVQSIREGLEDIRQQFSPREYFEVFDATTEREDAIEYVADQGDVNTDIGYINNHESIPGYRHSRILLTGDPASGKTRTLLQLTREHLKEQDITEVVVPDEAFVAARDIAPLLHRSFSGDVLLIWDDIHLVLGEDSSQVFREVIVKLEQELPDGAELWVLSTAVASKLDAIRRGTNIGQFLDTFERAVQPDLDREEVEAVLSETAATYNIEVPEEHLQPVVTQILETNPTPGYVQTLLKTLPDDVGRLTLSDIEDVPTDTRAMWEREYRTLRQSDEKLARLLICAKLLSEIHAPLFESMLRGLFVGALNEDPVAFAASVEQLKNGGWLKSTAGRSLPPSVTEYSLHGVKIEAIVDDVNGYLESVSEFLLTEVQEYIPDGEGSLEVVLQTTFASKFAHELPAGRAEKHHQRALDLDSSIAPVHSNYAVWLKYEGRLEEADHHYQRSVELSDDNPALLSNYGVFLEELDEFDDAEELLKNALDSEELPRIHYNYANLKRRMGHKRTAESHFQTAISDSAAESRTETDARVRYALLLLDEHRLDDAEEQINAALDADPTCSQAHQTRAKLMRQKGDDKGTLESYEEAIKYGQNDVRIWIDYAQFLLAEGREDEIVLLYRRASNEALDDEVFRSICASGLVAAGEYEEARELLENLLTDLASTVSVLLLFQSYLLLVKVCREQDDYTDAFTHCRQSLELLSAFERGGEFEELTPGGSSADGLQGLDDIKDALQQQHAQLTQIVSED